MSGTVKQKQWGAVGEFHNGGDGNIGAEHDDADVCRLGLYFLGRYT